MPTIRLDLSKLDDPEQEKRWLEFQRQQHEAEERLLKAREMVANRNAHPDKLRRV